MPITGAFDPSAQVFRTTASGRLSISELSQHIAAVRQEYGHKYPGLVDARGVHTLAFGRRDLMRFAQEMRVVLGSVNPAPRAVVVDGLVYFGMARLFASIVAGWMRIGVFDDIETAESWLTAVGSAQERVS